MGLFSLFFFFFCRTAGARRCWLGQEGPARLRRLLELPGAGCGERIRRQELSQCSASCHQPWEPPRVKAKQAEASSWNSGWALPSGLPPLHAPQTAAGDLKGAGRGLRGCLTERCGGGAKILGCPSPRNHRLRACLGQDFAAFAPQGLKERANGCGERQIPPCCPLSPFLSDGSSGAFIPRP